MNIYSGERENDDKYCDPAEMLELADALDEKAKELRAKAGLPEFHSELLALN